jgi:zeaxanthin glucosyltransferase
VVAYAPQSQLIARASLVITHGGLNTVMGSLSAGVPMVVIPITNDQPGVASRVVQTGAGERIAPKQLQTEGLKQMIVQVLTDANYRTKAQAMQQRIQQAGGVRRAADIIIASAPPGINRLQ